MASLQHTKSSSDLLAVTEESNESALERDTVEAETTTTSDSSSVNSMAGGDVDVDEKQRLDSTTQTTETTDEGKDVVMMDVQTEGEGEGEGDNPEQMENVQTEEELLMQQEMEAGPSQEGKRVKVYELRDSSWFDRGTGFCKGIYDDGQDLALLIVESEDTGGEGGKAEEPGGFLKEDLLLSSRVERDDIYGKQQETLIVWTEPASGMDIALSFQDAEGCDDIWQFICEVQKHLNNMPSESESQVPSSSSPISASPMLGVGPSQMSMAESRVNWQVPTLANIKEQEMWLRMQAKSPIGRERAVEHIINEDYIKHLISVLEQAEDLESLEDLHALCSLMQTILLFNDNGIFEYILQDEIFMGVIGMLEYDPEFPNLKASYRQFFQETARFRQVVEIKDDNIRNKIHQTYRLLYLKDVVLARVLDDPTFNILNGFVFFNQVDIINHIQQNDSFLNQLFEGFRDLNPDSSVTASEPLDEKKRDVVMFLHQLMIMGKGVQLPGRLALYRNLVERGLLFVCEWAFRRTEAQLLHAGAEILTLAVEHDANVVRMHVFKEDEAKRRTLVMEIIGLLHTTKNMGLMSQMCDTLKTLLETPPETEAFLQRKEGPLSDTFGTYFYENCALHLFKPLLEAPDIKAEIAKGNPAKLPRERGALLQLLVELLSFCVINHAHRASYFILANPISKKVAGLLYVKDKPLRHASLRFVRACLKTPNHFIHRHYVKNNLLLPVLELLEDESTRDNMMSSACMEVLDLIRKDNLKAIINYLFENYRERIELLGERPFLRAFVFGLKSRWEMNNEPPPPPPAIEAESSKAWTRNAEAEEEEYFNGSDDEEIGPKQPSASPTIAVSPTAEKIPAKRKRMYTHGGGPKKRSTRAGPASPVTGTGTLTAGQSAGGGALGLDYDDGSDSDSSGGASPRIKPDHLEQQASSSSPIVESTPAQSTEELEEDLGDVAMRMRAKRQREEEEEEGFAGLLVGGKPPTASTAATVEKQDTTTTPTPQTESKKTPVKDLGKKIRLNFKLGGRSR
ncbi:hypothetical protein CI109_107322 [Kwoniella shandongensis]|uniref:Uncharacterized protein n=1 Tax=Kwoniella shandongensis TaxID=1734106 RepID=A0A5M6BWB4_9TREE|nr:uncharacterized protein CI109_004750 [Kwoniella shandongensis]KAA5526973.1 hypothetical protein CI109_004750 [Kwoniella shandongensis]